MIRLNDINKTVIDEKEIKSYSEFKDNYYDYKTEKNVKKESIVFIHGLIAHYDSKEARDKDIELLDKIFDVKSIEEQIKVDELKKEVASHDMGVTSEYVRDYLKNLNACEPAKEEYLTWEEVKRTNTTIKAELPNGEIAHISWSDGCIYIYPKANVCVLSGTIYSSRVFNALKLKKVE